MSELAIVAVFFDGKTFANMTMVAAGITLKGEKHVLGFVETGAENEQVLTPFLRELFDYGLDRSLGLLVIYLMGKKGCGPVGRPPAVNRNPIGLISGGALI